MLKVSTWDEEITLEFVQMLKDVVAMVRGISIPFSPKIIAEIMEFPLAGEEFLETMDLVMATA